MKERLQGEHKRSYRFTDTIIIKKLERLFVKPITHTHTDTHTHRHTHTQTHTHTDTHTQTDTHTHTLRHLAPS